MKTTEELKAAARKYADEKAPGWELLVITAHDADGVVLAMKVRPIAAPVPAPAAAVTRPILLLPAAS